MDVQDDGPGIRRLRLPARLRGQAMTDSPIIVPEDDPDWTPPDYDPDALPDDPGEFPGHEEGSE